MNKAQAIAALDNGHKVRHRYFTKEEWIKQGEDPSTYESEEGVIHPKEEFWRWRPSGFDTDWSIVEEETPGCPSYKEVSNIVSVDCPDNTSAFVRYILEGEVKEADFKVEGGVIILPKGARAIRVVFKEEETPGCVACAGKMTRHIVGCPKRSKK